jgi:hypothetical protein
MPWFRGADAVTAWLLVLELPNLVQRHSGKTRSLLSTDVEIVAPAWRVHVAGIIVNLRLSNVWTESFGKGKYLG